MKKILFCAICMQLIAATGCNNNDKTDSTETKNKELNAEGPGAVDPPKTMDTLTAIYPVFVDSLIELVKFNYIAFIDSIKEMKVTEIYMVYGAYTEDDTARYLANHTGITKPDRDILKNRPCLLVGYKDATSGMFSYRDFGTLCPPPGSCQSFFMPLGKVSPAISTFDPNATIKNYFSTYDTSSKPLTTTMVKFNVANLQHYVDSLDKLNPPAIPPDKATDIYFQMGAYTAGDAKNYILTRPGKEVDIVGKPCLLFVYKNSKLTVETYLDFGEICPPGK